MVETLDRGGQAPGRRWPTSSTGTSTARSATTRASTRSTTARARRVGGVATRWSGSRSTVARRSSASTARSERARCPSPARGPRAGRSGAATGPHRALWPERSPLRETDGRVATSVPEVADPQGLQVLRGPVHAASSSPASRSWWARTAAASPTSSTPWRGCSAPRGRGPCARRRWKTSSSRAPPTVPRSGGPRCRSPSTTAPVGCPVDWPRSPSRGRCSARARASTPSTARPAGCSTSRSCSRTRASAASST